MTKEQFAAEIENKLSKIKDLQESIRQLKTDYINENSPFKIGDPIFYKGYRDKLPGFISDIIVMNDGTIRCLAKKCKKDGTISMQGLTCLAEDLERFSRRDV